ncbi:MAG: AAA family ATPase, partial [Coriobacteriales bacterium]|nr:AAA family ATPase [Coriobacteriales bacterium]
MDLAFYRSKLLDDLNADWRFAMRERTDSDELPRCLEINSEQISQYPGYIQDGIFEVQIIDAKLSLLRQDKELVAKASELLDERYQILKLASFDRVYEQAILHFRRQITEVYARVGSSGRALNILDKRRIAQLREKLQRVDVLSEKNMARIPEALESQCITEYQRLERAEDHRLLERGLLLTGDMIEHIEMSLPALSAGRPVMFVGDTGGAKTALTKFISREYFGVEPELVSFHGEVNAYQLMGKEGLKGGETIFKPGPVVRALESGTPLILDEINAAPNEFLKRLNEITQLRPGHRFRAQEDSGREIVVQPGFCVLATANEKSARYKGVNVMSAELKNRFGANIRRVQFPDSEVVTSKTPTDNMRLAAAALVDDNGEFLVEMPDEQLDSFVKASHFSQRLFTGNYDYREAAGVIAEDRIVDDKPGLEDTVLSPRMMASVLEQFRDSRGSIELARILSD